MGDEQEVGARRPRSPGSPSCIPRAATADRSPNGSMKTRPSSRQAERRLAVPLERMCSFGRRGLGVLRTARRAERRRRRDQAGDDRERERRVQAGAERAEISCGKNVRPVSDRLAVRRQRGEHVRADEVLDRVVAEERGEQDRHRRQLCATERRRRRRRRAPRGPPPSVCGSVAASPTIISEKKIPTESTCAEFWNVWFIAAAGAAVAPAAGSTSPPRGWARRTSPSRSRSAAGRARTAGRRSSSAAAASSPKPTAAASIPPVANGRAPKRSDR